MPSIQKQTATVSIDEIPDLVLILDRDFTILQCNQQTKFLAYTPQELKGKRLNTLFFDPEEKEKTSYKSFETRFKAKDGLPIPVEVRMFPLGGKKGGHCAWVRDLRDSMDLRSFMFQKGRVTALNEISPGFIHDIRNSLSILGAQHYFMKHNVDKLDTEKFLAGLDIIQKASLKIEKILNQLRDLIRSEDKFQDVPIRELVERNIYLLEPKSRKYNVQILNNVPINIDLNCVPRQIEQVIFHLLDNAIDAASQTPERVVTVDAKSSQESVTLLIQDTGVGVGSEIKDKIFDSFFTTKPKGEGAGLGLYVAKHLASKHGGQIRVESEQGQGARFLVNLPKTRI